MLAGREVAPDTGGGTAPLVVAGVSRAYGRRLAVRNVSFELWPGGVTGLLGPNGAGKTSLLSCIAGTASWDSGDISVGGVDAARRPMQARRQVGYMPERIAFWNEMTIESYLVFVGRVKAIPRHDRAEAVERALFRAGLVDVRGRIIGNLSKGYRQRVGLAQALLGEPPVVILDEPMAGLDPLNAIEIREVLAEYAEERVVLLSTHVIADVRMMCSRVIMMSQGSVVSDGKALAISPASGARRVRFRVGRLGAGAERVETLVMDAGARPIRIDLGASPAAPDAYGAEVTVETPDDAVTERIVRAFVDAGLAVYGVEATTDTLEEAFREAVQQAHDTSAGEG
jgi:ABC-2 type transport system ATP-binding protein